jgi:uncharacterized RDD family membrane protein YckC
MEANVHCVNHFDSIEELQHCARCGRVFCPDCLVMLRGLPYCAACKTEQALDVQSGVDPMQTRYAHLGRRFLAFIVDAIIIGIPMQVFSGVMQAAMVFFKSVSVQLATMGGVLVISVAITVAYEALMLLLRNGQTIGKLALQIRVVRVDGSPLSKREAWIRPIVRFFAAALCGADYFPAFFTAERTAIHDMAAGTRVINA